MRLRPLQPSGAALRARQSSCRGLLQLCSMRRSLCGTMVHRRTSFPRCAGRGAAQGSLMLPGMLSTKTYVALQALEIIPGRLFICAMRTADGMQRSNIALSSICYCIDTELVLGTAIPRLLSFAMLMAEPTACDHFALVDERCTTVYRCMSHSTLTLVL